MAMLTGGADIGGSRMTKAVRVRKECVGDRPTQRPKQRPEQCAGGEAAGR